MKTIIFSAALTLATFFGFAQTIDLRHKIEVTGTAEQEVTPDIIYVLITLQEYMDGKTKINISDLEGQLENAIIDAGIPKDDFTINDLLAYNNNYPKRKNLDFLASKEYLIKFRDLTKYNEILGKVDPKGIKLTRIEHTDYSKITELKRELLTKALQAAKDKATYLLTGIGEHLGTVLEISETDGGINNMLVYKSLSNVSYYNTREAGDSNTETSDGGINIKKIKLQFQVLAVFEIAGR